jgi:N6-adenosine-specific RNA methylase IME4/ParB-like chromosome segregation protein Spo0J
MTAADLGLELRRRLAADPTWTRDSDHWPLDHLRPHPGWAEVPPMAPAVYRALVADVAHRGIVTPLDILADGTVLDGRHRLLAAAEAGLDSVPVRVVAPDDPYLYMLDAALLRRDLTPGQRALTALKRKEYLAARHTHGGDRRSDQVAKLPLETPKSRMVAATLAGVSPRTLQDAIAVAEQAPGLAEQVRAGTLAVSAAARQLRREKNRRLAAATPDVLTHVAGQRYRTIVLDPPWQMEWDGNSEGALGRTRPTYATMPLGDIAALPVADLAEPSGCHLYLWVTNLTLPVAFGLVEGWGFRYVTALTWCKPSIGLGNYFRGSTEHVLFGVRGSLPLLAQDIGTWFAAPRGPDGHSAKPAEFYDLARRASPGPRLEMFARRDRPGWAVWGAEVTA